MREEHEEESFPRSVSVKSKEREKGCWKLGVIPTSASAVVLSPPMSSSNHMASFCSVVACY